MTDLQVVVHCFGDADFLEGTLASLESLPGDVPVHVIDGRHSSFPGDCDLTPAAPAICELYPNAIYHAPPADRLPWGHDREGEGPDRWPQYCQSTFTLSVLEPDWWTLKLDTDERLERFDVDLEALDPETKVHASVRLEEHATKDVTGEYAYIPRLWVPEHWTFWTGDAFVPRAEVDRDAGAPAVRAAVARGRNLANMDPSHRDEIIIENIGHERPPDYQDRREQQLNGIYA